MNDGRVLGVVPARMGSQRLPGKPLLPLDGRPLIEWVWRRVSSFSSLDACVVATDAAEIAAACAAFAAPVVLTSADHESGTDRVAEVAARAEYSGYGIVVNVQGDEPLIEESHVVGAVEQVRRGWDVGTVATPVRSLSAWRDPAVVKVTRRTDGSALYFSRAPIPHRRAGDPAGAELSGDLYLRHIGVYAYTRGALARWVAARPVALERAEKLEQLRPLAMGLTIGVAVVAHAEGGVDTAADVERVEAHLRARMQQASSRPTETGP